MLWGSIMFISSCAVIPPPPIQLQYNVHILNTIVGCRVKAQTSPFPKALFWGLRGEGGRREQRQPDVVGGDLLAQASK